MKNKNIKNNNFIFLTDASHENSFNKEIIYQTNQLVRMIEKSKKKEFNNEKSYME